MKNQQVKKKTKKIIKKFVFKYLLQIWNSKDLRKKIIFTIAILIVYRIVVQISIPGADIEAIRAIFNKNQILGTFAMLTGGSAKNFSIVLMGISPYINASIIMQLLTVIIPKLESISKEGDQGRKRINKYTRWATLPLAFVQSYGMIILLSSQSQIPILPDIKDPMVILPIMLTISTGTVFLVWLGELITEKGIGNGISLIIFTSIVSSVPEVVGQSLFLAQQNSEKLIPFVVMLLLTVLLTILIVLVTEGQRRIPITYAGRGTKARSEQSILPIRINQAGMIPIIFAVSIISFPSILGQFTQNAKSEWLRVFSEFLTTQFRMYSPVYLVSYFLLIFAFTFFYVSITFNPEQVAENVQKRGGYIPGIRPGKQTSDYLGKISNRLNLFGGAFLAFIAITPILIDRIFSSTAVGSVPLLISGAGMIIVVGVVLELTRQINAQMVMHDYSKFY